MVTMHRAGFEFRAVDATFWPTAAAHALQWLRGQNVSVSDTVLLLPFAELLPLARHAFATLGGWQPRIETTRTLAAALGPPAVHVAGALSLDPGTDRLVASALLRRQEWAAGLAQHDQRGFDHAVAALVDSAHALVRGASVLSPSERQAHWALAHRLLPSLAGPGATERGLARMALAWASASDGSDADRLFGHRPAAWVVLRCAGDDRLSERLLAHSDAPALVLDTDPAAETPFDALAAMPAPQRLRCDDLEHEAQAAATEVLRALQAGRAPVALIAQDRMVVRRVRALLARVPALRLHDETGWKLSTTRAAARLMALLRAAPMAAPRDAALDWLKADQTAAGSAPWLQSLEAQWRAGRPLSEPAASVWDRAQQRLQGLRAAPLQSLTVWLQALRIAMFTDEAAASAYAQDAAGRQVLDALHLGGSPGSDAWQAAAHGSMMELAEFSAWVDGVLEAATYMPPHVGASDVVITPLPRALLRPFGAVVFPGADEVRLGAMPRPDPLFGDAVATALGLDDVAAKRCREALAFAQLMRVPQVVLLRRASDAGEPLRASPLVERLLRARVRCGTAVPTEHAALLDHDVVLPQPVLRPAPTAPEGLPDRLSASAVQALRECPYRFYARVVLRLREDIELDAELQKRDYGSWLHAVLHHFHATRQAPQPLEDEWARLLSIGDQTAVELGFDPAQLLPYRAGFEALARRYLQWLQGRDDAGWVWRGGEVPLQAAPEALAALGVALHGRVDRIDDGVHALQLIDYKTGSAADLKRLVSQPLEDTQLAFYAALAEGAGLTAGRPLQALYLALDDRHPPQPVAHAEVARSAQLLVQGLAQDLGQVQAGQGLPALGEGRVCDYCEMRGLCRRDHWSQPPPPR